jgi:hypothetical protein
MLLELLENRRKHNMWISMEKMSVYDLGLKPIPII